MFAVATRPALFAPIVSAAKQVSLKDVIIALVIAFLLVINLAPSFAQSETLSLDIDPTPLFNSISAYVPLFFGILAVAGGILIGKKIAEFVIKAIADAF